ncbi:hypothetical protein NL473_28200, partial [Klebsiella pneumoniae]|nr:hypothetical protein [Klebsiella pneumoniae]MCP6594507.1 hypothetical protein [Klebsiella pneumoniae]
DEHQRPSVNIRLDSAGGRAVRTVSRDNIGKPMAMVLFEKRAVPHAHAAHVDGRAARHVRALPASGQPLPARLALQAGRGAPPDLILRRT